MDYHLKGEIRLKSTDDSQQSWCLQEFNNEGEQVGKDLEPHGGNANFTASNLSVSYRAGVSHFTLLGKEKESELNEYESIYGHLQPRVPTNRYFDTETYTLFRTDRTIQHFSFRIGKLADDADRHLCYLRGHPSFTSEPELGRDIEPDRLELAIGLLPASYDKLIAEIKSNRVDELNVELNYVPGFYSVPGWFTFSDDVKVLLRDDKPEAHQVVLPGDCEIDLPRLDEVKEFDITINQDKTFNLAQGVSETKQSVSEEDSDEEDSDPEPDVAEQMMTQLNRIETILDKLQIPIKLIVAILALILLTLLWELCIPHVPFESRMWG